MTLSFNVLVVHGNSTGLKTDAEILASALIEQPEINNVVCISKIYSSWSNIKALAATMGSRWLARRKLIVIHLEELNEPFIKLSKHQLFFPNQEWFRSHTQQLLSKYNENITVCCKTRYAEQLFQSIAKNVFYTGFSSPDKYNAEVNKIPNTFLHIAGKSEQKGTTSLITAWLQNPTWPKVTVISRREEHKHAKAQNLEVLSCFLSDKELNTLMNSHTIHLCPSESEGFGHTIWEGFSTGADVWLTNAPPMNEFINPLGSARTFDYSCTQKRYLSTLYKTTLSDVETTMNEYLDQSNQQKRSSSAENAVKNRKHFKQNSKIFRSNLVELIKTQFTN